MTPQLPRRLAEHPTVRKVIADQADRPEPSDVIDAAWLRSICLSAGADDVAFASVNNPDLASEAPHVHQALPGARSYISLVVKMNRENVRSTARSVANQEFHRSGEILNEAAREITRTLEDRRYRALNPSATFPMEMDRFPGRIWVVAHKPVAVAAGLGVMGIHRNVIHPRFGNFVLLGTILVDAEISSYGQPLDYSPCLECKLCVAACPVGAIGKDGEFDFFACSTHNYREFMGGFTDWAQTIADSSDAADFRSKVTDSENASMWQSLSFKPNYKAAYCLAVCPAGDEVIEPYLDDRKEFMDRVLKPLQDKRETLYVLPNSAAKAYAEKRFPHKPVKVVDGGVAGRAADPPTA
ncbi:4Fe-4S binding protein [Candidatus Mycobacterium wuenschmannii]|uniref:4Fe-4S binding protein n=1 Tax=Candidatus Mycobacterium wuenschmannii TaxID=3027808 RepID=A0ABY8W3N8_9MYCO|nr:4Fe-4S binding protein [Candidatus Mycobacterium wuenschmannii]WIM89077.1 4Fe-4S binding protein [Candidatus Mycobacterium wuenschmannii]